MGQRVVAKLRELSGVRNRVDANPVHFDAQPLRSTQSGVGVIASPSTEAALRYANKHIFVAGGTTGINLGIAQAFVAEGANVFVISRKADNVTDAVALLASAGTAAGTTADVRQFDQIQAAFTEAVAAFGPIDVVVSGAAGNFPAFANAMSPNGFRSVIEIDLLGSFHVARAAFPHLRKPGASLIHVSAPQAWVPMEAQAHVCAAKAGVDMLTRVLAMEWGPSGVRVNSVVPGPIDDTEGMRRLAPTPELRELCQKSVPIGRLGRVEDIGRACLSLASDDMAFVTGAVLPVDGGWALGGASQTMTAVVSMGKALGMLPTGA